MENSKDTVKKDPGVEISCFLSQGRFRENRRPIKNENQRLQYYILVRPCDSLHENSGTTLKTEMLSDYSVQLRF